MKWQEFLPTAQRIVEAEKALWPNSDDVMGFGAGGSTGSYARQGVGDHRAYYDLPTAIGSLVDTNAANAATDPSLATQQTTKLSSLMTDTTPAQPGYSSLLSIANQDPTDYTGRSALVNASTRDPYSGAFEANTKAAYQQRAGDAMAQVASGPTAVRGGAARTDIAQGTMADRLAQNRGYEVRQAQQQDIQNVLGSSMGAADIEQKRAATTAGAAQGLANIGSQVGERALGAIRSVDFGKLNNMQMLKLASVLRGTQHARQTDDFSGKGNQMGTQTGVSCCFTFLEALNGVLPWQVEMGRSEFYTPQRRRGYKWMSRKLVPAMQKHAWLKRSVNKLLVKPFIRYGEWRYSGTNKWTSALYAPYCFAWLATWGLLGKLVKEPEWQDYTPIYQTSAGTV